MEDKKVDFIIVGAQKCGTTSLAGQLDQIDEICFCKEKEPHFFSKNKHWKKELEQYLELYDSHGGQLLGEASTTYSFCDEYPAAISSLYEHNPDMKLIYLVRDPIARIESHFNHRLRNNKISRNVIIALGNYPCFFERSEYFRQIQHIRKTFPENQIKIIIFEQFIKEPRKILAEVLSFLDLPHEQLSKINFSPKNVSDASLKMSSSVMKALLKVIEKIPFSYKLARWLPIKIKFSIEDKRVLWRALENDVQQLEEYLGQPLSLWRNKYMFKEGYRL